MKNLQNFGVQELSAKEKENINGGDGGWIWGLVMLAAGLIVKALVKNGSRVRGYVNGQRVY